VVGGHDHDGRRSAAHRVRAGESSLLGESADGGADGEPLLAIDALGAAAGTLVVLTNDGAGARELVGARNSPVRWMVLGVCD